MWEQHETSGRVFLGASLTPPLPVSPSLALSYSAALSLRGGGAGGGGDDDPPGESNRAEDSGCVQPAAASPPFISGITVNVTVTLHLFTLLIAASRVSTL